MSWTPHAVDMKDGFNHRIFVKRSPKKTHTEGGLEIAQSSQEHNDWGTVIQSSTERIPQGVDVLYNRWNGTDIEMDGEQFTVFDEAEIMGTRPHKETV